MNRPVGVLKITAILMFAFAGIFFVWLIWNKSVNTLYVANNGIDSDSCGDRNAPCRSISQAIALAKASNVIEVGPGRYGDLNGNGIFKEPGEEFALGDSMIDVDKPVKLISSAGSLTTVLDAGGARLSTVSITVNNVIFGLPKHGFLITGAKANGLTTATVSNITVAGNTALANGQGGIVVDGNVNLLHDNVVSGNLAAGIAVFGVENDVHNNIANSNGSEGFVIAGSKHVLLDNVAANNAIGFGIQGTNIRLLKNSALGNRFFGISIDTPETTGTAISNNNIYGNNSVPLSGLTHCGIHNESGNEVIATDNFWGMSSGPGADPADNAGSGSHCDIGLSHTLVSPFAKQSYSIP